VAGDGTNLPAVRAPLPELCPPREVLVSYARGGRDPGVARHISACEPCAWIVSEAMEADSDITDAEVIDITPQPTSWERVRGFIRNLTNPPRK
jgi:hypothetical protein